MYRSHQRGAPQPPGAARAAPIHDAVNKQDVRAVVKALHDDPASVNTEDEKYGTPLQLAVWDGEEKVAEILLSKGAKLDVYSAAGLGKTDDLERFLKNAPRLANSSDRDGCSPLHYAAKYGKIEAARILLDHNADANALTGPNLGDPTPPLYDAVFHGDTAMVKLLLDGGADLHFKEGNGESLLHLATFTTRPMVELLLDRKLDVNARSKYGVTPLHHAAFGGHAQIAALLLEHGADINAKDREGHTPIYEAAYWRHMGDPQGRNTETAEFLLRKGAKLDFLTAVRLGRVAQAEALLKDDPKVMQSGGADMDPLHEAAFFGHTAMLKFLLDHGAATDERVARALSVAAAMGHREIAGLLLERGAAMDAPMIPVPLEEAATNGYADVVRRGQRPHGGRRATD